MSKVPYRVYLSEEEIPRRWYNLRADMKEQHDPYINPAVINLILPLPRPTMQKSRECPR